MGSRVARLSILVLLLATGAGASWFAWSLERDAQAVVTSRGQLSVRLSQLGLALGDLRVAQGGYVAPGQQDGPWLARVATLVRQISEDITAIRESTHSPQAALRLGQLSDAVTALFDTDTRAREYVRRGDDLMAADLIFREAQEKGASITAALRQLETEQTAELNAEEAMLRQRQWAAVAGAGALWLIGLLLFVRIPAPRQAALEQAIEPDAASPEPPAATVPAMPPPAPSEADIRRPVMDLTSAASICTALSRVSDTTALPDLLARAATLLDASGLIVWMAAGADLFAVMAHGYDPRVVSLIGPINQSSDNATAMAWRLERLRIVAGSENANGAIVAPMFGPEGCIGAFAAELRHGREHDEGVQAVTTMIAAQLAAVVAAWPTASTGSPAADAPAEPVAEPDQPRKAAGL